MSRLPAHQKLEQYSATIICEAINIICEAINIICEAIYPDKHPAINTILQSMTTLQGYACSPAGGDPT